MEGFRSEGQLSSRPKKKAHYGKRSQQTNTAVPLWESPENRNEIQENEIQDAADGEDREGAVGLEKSLVNLRIRESSNLPITIPSSQQQNQEIDIERSFESVRKPKKSVGNEALYSPVTVSPATRLLAKTSQVTTHTNNSNKRKSRLLARFTHQVHLAVRQQRKDRKISDAEEDVIYIEPILSECKVMGLMKFDDFATELAAKLSIEKIAEGSFGEVYSLTRKPTLFNQSGAPRGLEKLEVMGGCIFKIIPLNAPSGPGSAKYTSISNVVREVKISKIMDTVHGFTRFRDVRVVQGKYPAPFINAFDRFTEKIDPKMRSCLNPHPSKTFRSKQFYAIIEMDNAGKELETLRHPSVFQIWDIFWTVAILHAWAEERTQFEHRDLHESNLCYQPWFADGRIDVTCDMLYMMEKIPAPLLGITSIRPTIIDYTLSRATSSSSGEVSYHAMNGSRMFNHEPRTAEEEWQKDSYEQARIFIEGQDRGKKNNDEDAAKWAKHVPKTNVVWLSYLIRVLRNRDINYMRGSPVADKLQTWMMVQIREIRILLDVALGSRIGPNSATEFVVEAKRRGWLSERDLEGMRQRFNEHGE